MGFWYTFAVILLQTVLLYMMSAIVLPDVPNDGGVDLRGHYYREVVPLYSTSLLMLSASIAKDWMLNGRLPSAANLGFHAFFAGVATLALLNRKPVVQLCIALSMVLFSIVYVSLLFARLGQS